MFKIGLARSILAQRAVLQTCYSRNICLGPTLYRYTSFELQTKDTKKRSKLATRSTVETGAAKGEERGGGRLKWLFCIIYVEVPWGYREAESYSATKTYRDIII